MIHVPTDQAALLDFTATGEFNMLRKCFVRHYLLNFEFEFAEFIAKLKLGRKPSNFVKIYYIQCSKASQTDDTGSAISPQFYC